MKNEAARIEDLINRGEYTAAAAAIDELEAKMSAGERLRRDALLAMKSWLSKWTHAETSW